MAKLIFFQNNLTFLIKRFAHNISSIIKAKIWLEKTHRTNSKCKMSTTAF